MPRAACDLVRHAVALDRVSTAEQGHIGLGLDAQLPSVDGARVVPCDVEPA